jgi:hypothetical protein
MFGWLGKQSVLVSYIEPNWILNDKWRKFDTAILEGVDWKTKVERHDSSKIRDHVLLVSYDFMT